MTQKTVLTCCSWPFLRSVSRYEVGLRQSCNAVTNTKGLTHFIKCVLAGSSHGGKLVSGVLLKRREFPECPLWTNFIWIFLARSFPEYVSLWKSASMLQSLLIYAVELTVRTRLISFHTRKSLYVGFNFKFDLPCGASIGVTFSPSRYVSLLCIFSLPAPDSASLCRCFQDIVPDGAPSGSQLICRSFGASDQNTPSLSPCFQLCFSFLFFLLNKGLLGRSSGFLSVIFSPSRCASLLCFAPFVARLCNSVFWACVYSTLTLFFLLFFCTFLSVPF